MFVALVPSGCTSFGMLLWPQPSFSPPFTSSFLSCDYPSLQCHLCIQAGWRREGVCDICTTGTNKPAELLTDQILMECESQGVQVRWGRKLVSLDLSFWFPGAHTCTLSSCTNTHSLFQPWVEEVRTNLLGTQAQEDGHQVTGGCRETWIQRNQEGNEHLEIPVIRSVGGHLSGSVEL